MVVQVYALTRLIKGMGSARMAARQGFSTALAALLAGRQGITTAIVHELVARELAHSNSMKASVRACSPLCRTCQRGHARLACSRAVLVAAGRGTSAGWPPAHMRRAVMTAALLRSHYGQEPFCPPNAGSAGCAHITLPSR